MLTGLDGILDQLIHTMDPTTLNSYLDPIIRIRAVQNFTPSQATAFILSLKKVLREYLAKDLQDHRMAAEFIEFESKIDQLCLIAFDTPFPGTAYIYQTLLNKTGRFWIQIL